MFTSIHLKFSIDHLTKKQSRQSKEKKPNSPCAECLSRRQRPLLASLKKTYSWVIWSTIALYTSQHTSRMFRFPEFRLTLKHLSILPPLEELGIPPSKLAHTGVSILEYDERPVGKIRIRLQIGDLTSEATFYAIRGRACYSSRQTMDSWQSCGPIYSSSVLQVCGCRQSSTSRVRR